MDSKKEEGKRERKERRQPQEDMEGAEGCVLALPLDDFSLLIFISRIKTLTTSKKVRRRCTECYN